jgi:hypothetical protein
VEAGSLCGDSLWENELPIQVNGGETLGLLLAQCGRNGRTPVSTLRYPAFVAESFHQNSPGVRCARRIPAVRRLVRETKARLRRYDHMEGIFGAATVGGRVYQRVDQRQKLEHRTWPAVRKENGQSVRILGRNMKEVDSKSIDLGAVPRVRVELTLHSAHVLVVSPVIDQSLSFSQRNTLAPIAHRLLRGPARCGESCFQVVDSPRVNIDLKRLDGVVRVHGSIYYLCPEGRDCGGSKDTRASQKQLAASKATGRIGRWSLGHRTVFLVTWFG